MNIYFETYGCTLNRGEERRMVEIALRAGHQLKPRPDQADILVVLTCTVIEQTELKILRRLNSLSKGSKILVVTGCMSAVQADKIRAAAPNAVLIPTPGQVDGFEKFINNGSFDPGPAKSGAEHAPELRSRPGLINDASAAVPIAEGCVGNCTYCITRLARGSLNSRGVDAIVEDVKGALRSGACEIRLTAQDSAAYGLDSDNGPDLPGLLERLCELPMDDGNEFRIRVGMMNPNSVLPMLDRLIDAYRHPRIFKFLHLPVQSGSDNILSAMARRYSVEQFKTFIGTFRTAFPALTLSTDLIVGFPGETENDHDLNRELMKEIRPNIVNLTRYSERNGTPSVKLPNKIHGRISKERSRDLTRLCKNISLDLNRTLIGSEFGAIATERDIGKHEHTTLLRTDEYRPIVIASGLELGKRYHVRVVSAAEAYLRGELT